MGWSILPRILYVDNDAECCKSARWSLRQYDVISATDASEAIGRMQNQTF